MSKPTPVPDEATLRRFLLGTLAPEEAESVSRWAIESDCAAQLLGGIVARDTVVDAISAAGTEEDPSTPPRLIKTVVQVVSPVVPHSVAVGGFRVIRELGRGGMGIVLEAEDTHLKRSVAIKLIACEYANSPAARDRFLREARAVARIEHENVVPILHVGEDAGQLYLVMPLLKGETLDARLKRDTRLPVGELLRIGREVAAGLAAAHAVGLVHRDVKPANIWLEAGTGRVKLLDFGLAKPTEEEADANLTDPGAVLGTPHYMSPEQAEGKPVDSRTDLFSLGAVLYHAATGRRPFQGDSKLAVLLAVTSETPAPAERLNASLPPRVADLLHSLLEKDPKDRPDSATAVITQLQGAPAPKAGSPPARFPRWAIATGLLAAAVLVASVVVIIRDKDGKEVARITVPEGGSVEIKSNKGGAEIGKAAPAPATSTPDLKAGSDIGQAPPVAVAVPGAPGSDRKAAEYVLSLGGTVRVNDKDGNIEAVADLPKESFRLTGVGLAKNSVVTNAGLAAFKDCKNLTELNLALSEVGDAGLVHFKGCTKLYDIDVSGTQVTDAGLPVLAANDKLFRLTANVTDIGDAGLAALEKHTAIEFLFLNDTKLTDASLKRFASLKRLAVLQIDGTAVTDTGLAALAGNAALRGLDVRKTTVTATGVAALAKALPLCRIQWDGGVIEPRN